MEMAQLGLKARTHTRREAQARNQSLAMATGDSQAVKKRKLNEDGELIISASYIQLRSRRITLNNSTLIEDELCPSPNSDQDDLVSVSCCSSNGSSEEVNERTKFLDLEVHDHESVEVETSAYYSCREESGTTPSCQRRAEREEGEEESYDLDSTTKKTSTAEADSRRKSTVENMMPSKLEIEEFFTEAEKNIQKEFIDKYNYDIVKDQPLEGRFEWVRLRP